MDSGINEGWSNELIVQAESSFAGSVTGTARHLPGKVTFSYEPVLLGSLQSVNVWRMMDGDSFSGRSYRGQFDLEYSHGETIALLLSSLLKRSGSSPNYVFNPYHLSDRQSLAIGLSYLPNAQHLVFRGVIIDSASFTIRARELLKVRFEFKAAKMTTDGPLTSAATETRVTATGNHAAAEYESAAMSRAFDSSFQIIHRIDFANFGEDAIPTDYEPTGPMTVSADLAELMANTSVEGDRIALDVRSLNEASALISVVPSSGKLLELEIPRMLVRSGTPPGLATAGISYRAGVEAQTQEDRTDRPVLTMTI